MKIILASASPRRRELLAQIGLEFEVMVSDVDEVITETEPALIVEQLSSQKADAVFRKVIPCENEATDKAGIQPEDTLVIGADTVVVLAGKILGKPADREEAIRMLTELQGRSHEVYTGVTLICRNAAQGVTVKTFHECTEVTFYPMSAAEIEEYVATGDCMDKAGAYGIQGFCARYISGIRGDYNNVVGLPVARLYREAKCFLQKRAVKAAIFDLDGTLSDSIASIKYCGDRALADVGVGSFPESDYKYFVGDGAANLIKRALVAAGDTELSKFEVAFARYKEYFAVDCMYQVKPYEGIPELLKALKRQGIKLTVLSNKPHLQTIDVIHSLFGEECFDIIQGQKDGIPIKPDPSGAFEIMKALDVKPEEVLYLGDTATDMKTGKSAGAFTIGVLWGFREVNELKEANADEIIKHPLEVFNYIKGKVW